MFARILSCLARHSSCPTGARRVGSSATQFSGHERDVPLGLIGIALHWAHSTMLQASETQPNSSLTHMSGKASSQLRCVGRLTQEHSSAAAVRSERSFFFPPIYLTFCALRQWRSRGILCLEEGIRLRHQRVIMTSITTPNRTESESRSSLTKGRTSLASSPLSCLTLSLKEEARRYDISISRCTYSSWIYHGQLVENS